MTKRKLGRNILIVCEGTKTEYDYFLYIKENISEKKGIWDNVVISNNNTIPKDIPISATTELGRRANKKFLNPNKRAISERNVLRELCKYLYGNEKGMIEYESIKAVPLRYVAQAQLIEKEQNMYEELWAVFDKDGHSHHKEAYLKAEEKINGKKVQIGLSCRSFEHWIILHFEKNKNEFLRSQCKDERNKPIECSVDLGCKGFECLSGYIRANTRLKNYKKSNNEDDLIKMMNVLLESRNLIRAFENAQWLRDEIRKDPQLKNKKCYELNSYTDVDLLVKKLIE